MNGAVVHAYSRAQDGGVWLTANFRVEEFACKDGSDTIFISSDLAKLLQQIRTHFAKPLIINSAYRTEAHNRAVGGSPSSRHLYGMAADIVVQGIAPEETAAFAETLLPHTGGIGRYADFTHVDVRRVSSRWTA